ncbi:hypothetical protein [Amphritea sp. HPY]|uniref:hypothetical protein n=1 Tax=Amphritea sp. HPY TaxID=3421652 RepID=UPI003D7D75B2
MSYSNIYPENQVLAALDAAYHTREQQGKLTATVTTKFQTDATSKGVVKMLDKLKLKADPDHDAAVDALVELIS